MKRNCLFYLSFILFFNSVSIAQLMPNDTYRYPNSYGLYQWNLDEANVPEAWSIETGKSFVKVAVIDFGGVDRNHEDLQNVVIDGFNGVTNTAGPLEAGYGPTLTDGKFSLVGTLGSSALYCNQAGNPLKGALYTSLTGDPAVVAIETLLTPVQRFWDVELLNEKSFNDFSSKIQLGSTIFPDFGYHATCVAGIIAANTDNSTGVAGIAGGWNDVGGVKIMPIRVVQSFDLGEGGNAIDALYPEYCKALANGIIWAADNGADVINMSIGGLEGLNSFIIPKEVSQVWFGYTDIRKVPLNQKTVKEAIEYAYNKGCVLVASAGNGNFEYGNTSYHDVCYPGRDTHVIGVAAITKEEKLQTMSSYGPEVDIVAPGDNVPSTDVMTTAVGKNNYEGSPYLVGDPSGNYYNNFGITSAAAPHVSGVAALIRSIIQTHILL